MLGSFSYGKYRGADEISEEILSLLVDRIQTGQSIDYAFEIIDSALSGSIDFDNPFNYDAYVYAIEKNRMVLQNKNRQRELQIIPDFDKSAKEDDYRTPGLITEYTATMLALQNTSLQDTYTDLLDSMEVEDYVNRIKHMSKDLLLVENLSLLKALKNALKGYTGAVEEIKRVCETYPMLATALKGILQTKEGLDLLLEP